MLFVIGSLTDDVNTSPSLLSSWHSWEPCSPLSHRPSLSLWLAVSCQDQVWAIVFAVEQGSEQLKTVTEKNLLCFWSDDNKTVPGTTTTKKWGLSLRSGPLTAAVYSLESSEGPQKDCLIKGLCLHTHTLGRSNALSNTGTHNPVELLLSQTRS